MFKTQAELIKKTTENIRQGKIIYQPELLSALYYIDYDGSNQTGDVNLLPDYNLMKFMTPIRKMHLPNNSRVSWHSNQVMWVEKHQFLPEQRPIEAFNNQTAYLLTLERNFERVYSLLLDNQLLTEIKAPYRSVLIDATCDIAQNYNEIIGLKHNKKETIAKLNHLVSQCLLLIDVNTGAILGGFPCLALLKYDNPKKQLKKAVKSSLLPQPQYDINNGRLKSNCISVTMKELQQITKLLGINAKPDIPIWYLMICDKLTYTLNTQNKMLIGTYTDRTPADITQQTLEINLVKYLRSVIKWHLTKKGHLRFNLLTPLPDWQKEIKQYQTDNLYLLPDIFQIHTITANPGSVFPTNNYNEQAEILGNVFNDHFLKYNLRQKTDLYQTFKFPKKATLTATKISLKSPKTNMQVMQPLMAATGVNSLMTTLKDQNSSVYYKQHHLFTLHSAATNVKTPTITVKDLKL